MPFTFGIRILPLSAAVSCFDEWLLEDTKVNRLEDSFHLWRTVCSSRLLSNATMVLFLNKCDLLERKLRSGLQVKTYLPSFGERSNDVRTVIKCTSFSILWIWIYPWDILFAN